MEIKGLVSSWSYAPEMAFFLLFTPQSYEPFFGDTK